MTSKPSECLLESAHSGPALGNAIPVGFRLRAAGVLPQPSGITAPRSPRRGVPELGLPRAAPTSYLPDLVRTIIAPLQHLKEASTAPTAAASVGSLVMGARRRSSSNNCMW